MTKAEIISQLKSLRDGTIDYAKGNNDPVFEKDVEAQGRQFIEGCIWCANWKYAVMPEDYCSNAKRKQN